jgi:hypothetical protein
MKEAQTLSLQTPSKGSFAKRDSFRHPKKDDGLFCSDWRKGAVFSQLISGGNRSPERVEGNAEGAELPHG